MKKAVHLQLSKLVGSSLNTRSAVHSIVTTIKEEMMRNNVVSIRFDFNAIDFVSRNAMHEMININKSLGNEDVMLVFENMNHEVQEMYELVNKATSNKLNAIIKPYNITTVKEFNRLLAI